MKELILNLLKGIFLGTCFVVLCFVIASMSHSAYANHIHQKADELVLAGYQFSNGVHSAQCGFFVRNISMRSHVMAKLGRDTFMCAGIRLSLSANPFQLCHHYLAVLGKAPVNSNGVH